MTAPYINGRMFGWSDVSTIVGTVPLTTITEINYSEDSKIEPVYGAGSDPVGFGHGNTTYEGSMTITADEYFRLVAAAPQGKLRNLPPSTVTVMYKNPDSGIVITETLQAVIFTKRESKLSQGDTSFPVSISFIFGKLITV